MKEFNALAAQGYIVDRLKELKEVSQEDREALLFSSGLVYRHVSSCGLPVEQSINYYKNVVELNIRFLCTGISLKEFAGQAIDLKFNSE